MKYKIFCGDDMEDEVCKFLQDKSIQVIYFVGDRNSGYTIFYNRRKKDDFKKK